MSDQLAEGALYPANILTECFKSNVGDHPWIQANPEVALAVEHAILAMEAACEAIREKQSNCDAGEDSSQRQVERHIRI